MTNQETLLARIQELEAKIEELERDRIHDFLTGLKTRAFFDEEVRVFFDLMNAHDSHHRKESFGFSHLSILYVDIDYFKKINDTFGHATGDEVLKTVAKEIQDEVREEDIVARWGGEEMVVALLGANIEDARAKAENMRKNVLSLSFPSFPDLHVTVSIGIATFEKGISFEKTLERADSALYEAKESGRNIVVVWDESLEQKTNE